MQVDIGAEAVSQRLKLTSQLRRLAISLAQDRMDGSQIASSEQKGTKHHLVNEEDDFQKESK